jgi:hypothetical protein
LRYLLFFSSLQKGTAQDTFLEKPMKNVIISNWRRAWLARTGERPGSAKSRASAMDMVRLGLAYSFAVSSGNRKG